MVTPRPFVKNPLLAQLLFSIESNAALFDYLDRGKLSRLPSPGVRYVPILLKNSPGLADAGADVDVLSASA